MSRDRDTLTREGLQHRDLALRESLQHRDLALRDSLQHRDLGLRDSVLATRGESLPRVVTTLLPARCSLLTAPRSRVYRAKKFSFGARAQLKTFFYVQAHAEPSS